MRRPRAARLLPVLAYGVFWAGFANAQALCSSRDRFLEQLFTGYDERPVAFGLASSGQVVEVLVSPTGSWTIIATMPNGAACVIAAGEGWETVPAAPPAPVRRQDKPA